MKNKLEQLKKDGEAPEFLTEEGLRTLSAGYLLPDETPKGMYQRLAKAAASYYADKDKWEEKFFNAMWKNWLCPASPICSNMGSKRGLPISCNSIHVKDSLDDIFMKNHELAMLSKNGAGVGIYMGDLRSRGETIAGNGKSEGIIPWAKCYDSTTVSVSQGSTRRGASAIYTKIDSSDVDEFINMRRPVGDLNRRCLNTNHGLCISDEWMKSMLSGDKEKRKIWENLLSARVETGEPYLFFTDHVNNNNPECYKANDLSVKTSNICCLSGDTLVQTKNGPERIDSLVGKTTEIWDGKAWVKNDSFEHRGNDELTRIELADGSHIDSNDNHRWFVSKNYVEISKKKVNTVLTKDLVVGNYIEYHHQEAHGAIESNGAYVKGFLIGDGTSHKNIPMLNLHSTKFSCEENIIASLNEVSIDDGIRSDCVTISGFSDVIDNTGSGAYGTQIFKRLCGLTARKKSLINWSSIYKESFPTEVYSWNKKSKLLFLSGLLDADGTSDLRSNCLAISSISLSFIKDLQVFIKTFGMNASIDTLSRENTDDINHQDIHRLTISSSDSYELHKILSCSRIKNTWNKKPNRKLTTFRKIVSITKLDGIHPVYCPVLPSTGKFALANGVMTGNTEITLHTDPDHSFVCCLSSLNLVRWDEWKDTDTVNVAVRFLDAVLEEYIQKTENMKGMENSRRSAIKGRAIGIGVLGWHTLLQERNLPFDSFDTMMLNAEIFKSIRAKAEEETKVLAEELGEPEWCKGFNRRNTHLCVDPKTTLLTKEGFKEIKELADSNSELEIWNGHEWSMVKPYKTSDDSEMLEFTLSDGSVLKTTKYHQWLIKNNRFAKSKVVEAKDLQIGDKLEKWELPVIEGSEEFPHAYTHGFYCGDGSDNQSKPQYKNCKVRKEVRLYNEDKKCLTMLEVKENCSIRTQKDGSLRFYVPDDMPGKFVVPTINNTVKSRLEWLAGLYDADGCDMGALTSSKLDFLKQIKDMLAYTGVLAKISKVKRSGGYPTSNEYYWNLYITHSDIVKLKELGFNTQRISLPVAKINKQHFVKITKIEKIANSETYCLTEEKRGTALFNGVKTKQCAVAPTVSNSTISGGYSAGIEPIAANIFTQKSAKGTFIKKNPTLERLLETKNKNLPEVWKSINEQNGSVQHLSFLSKEEKEIFLTAREINQHAIVKLAIQRQKWVDQAQSVNLFFASNSSAKYIHEVHLAAWEGGLKTLYYCRSEGVLKGDLASRSADECKACEA